MSVTIGKNGRPFSHSVALSEYSDVANLHKFGKNSAMRAGEDIWDGSSAYPINTAAVAMEVVSTSTADAYDGTGGRVVDIYGVDVNWDEVSERVELNGQTAIPLENSYLYVHRMILTKSGSGNTNAGAIKVQTIAGSTLQAQISIGIGQTLMAVWAQPAGETLLIEDLIISGARTVAAVAEFALQVFTEGTAVQTKFTVEFHTGSGVVEVIFSSPIKVPPKSLVRVRCLSVSANDQVFSATFCGQRYYNLDKVLPARTLTHYVDMAVPTGFSATGLDGAIDLAWTDTNVGEDGYEIQRSLAELTGWADLHITAASVEAYADETVAISTTYYYRVRAVRNGIAVSDWTSPANDSCTVLAPDTLAAAEDENVIALSWVNNSTRDTLISIERSLTTGSGFAEIDTVAATETTYNDSAIVAGTEYFYRIRCLAPAGYSAYTSEASDTAVVLAPDTLAAAEDEDVIALSWTNNSTKDTTISIERSLTTGSGFAEIDTVAATESSYDDSTVVANTEYFYRIRALASSGYSAYTSEVSDTPVVLAPDTLVATGTESNVGLTWVNNSTKDTTISIERSLTTGSGFAEIDTVDDAETTYTDTNVASLTEYFYRVRALAPSGYSAYTAESSDTPAVLAPDTLAATGNESGIDLTWNNNSTVDTAIMIERSLETGANFSVIDTVDDAEVSYSDTTVTGGVQYFYRLRAVGPIGNSAYSAEADDTAAILPPTAMTATGTESNVGLAWTNNSLVDTAILIERSLETGANFSQIDSIDHGETTYTDATVTSGVEYFYRIRAQGPIGESAYTAEDNTTPAVLAPDTLVATGGDATVALTWSNNSSVDTSIQIERSLTTGSGFSLLHTVDDAEVSYDDDTAANGTEYFYRLRAVGPIGNSAYSAEDSATPAAATGPIMILGEINVGDMTALNGQYQLSTDGAGDVWSADNITGATAEMPFIKTIQAGDGVVCALTFDAATDPANIYTTTDGLSWTNKASAILARHYWMQNKWVTFDGTNIRSTTDFSTYATLAANTIVSSEVDIAGSAGVIVWIDGSDVLIFSTNGGTSFTPCDTQQVGAATTGHIKYLAGYFWRIDSDHLVYRSSDGDTWNDTSAGFTQDPGSGNSLAYDGTYVYALCSTDGTTSEIKHTDPDTISWVTDTPPVSAGFGVMGDGTQVIFSCVDASYANAAIYSYAAGSFTLEASPTYTVMDGAIFTPAS